VRVPQAPEAYVCTWQNERSRNETNGRTKDEWQNRASGMRQLPGTPYSVIPVDTGTQRILKPQINADPRG